MDQYATSQLNWIYTSQNFLLQIGKWNMYVYWRKFTISRGYSITIMNIVLQPIICVSNKDMFHFIIPSGELLIIISADHSCVVGQMNNSEELVLILLSTVPANECCNLDDSDNLSQSWILVLLPRSVYWRKPWSLRWNFDHNIGWPFLCWRADDELCEARTGSSFDCLPDKECCNLDDAEMLKKNRKSVHLQVAAKS